MPAVEASPDSPPRPSIRVVVTSTVALNGGDAAILMGQRETLERAFPAMELVVFDAQAEVSSRYFPDLRFRRALFVPRPATGRGANARLRWGIRAGRLVGAALALRAGRDGLAGWLSPSKADAADLATYAGADLVLTPGGTMLVEHYQLIPRMVDLAVTLVLGRRLVLFTQSLGPFYQWTRRLALSALLSRARLILVRGETSRRHVENLNVHSDRIRVAPDAAFLLADLATRPRPAPSRPLRVAISMRDWPFFRTVSCDVGQHRYEEAVAALCTWLVRERQADVVCMSTCQGVAEYWTDDSQVALRMVETLPAEVAERVLVDRSFRRPDEFRDCLRGFDIVVATRLHASILALCAGTPVVVIEYEQKATELFNELRLSEWVLEIETLSGSNLIDRVQRLYERRQAVADELSASVNDQYRRALAVADLLRAVVGEA